MQQLKALCGNLSVENGDASKIAAGTIEARHQAELDRISADYKNDWDGPRRRLDGQCGIACRSDDHRHLSAYQISGKRRQLFEMAVCRVVLYDYVAAF